MATEWEKIFGNDFLINPTNEERPYLALNPVEESWEMTVYYSKTNLWYKRTSVYWQGDIIKKIISEEKRIVDGKADFETYSECDTDLQTEGRMWLFPLTSRGKKKKVTPTNIMSFRITGCSFGFIIEDEKARMSAYNSRACKNIPIGENDKICKIKNDEDLHQFMKYYMETCPTDYFDLIKNIRESEHETVKYKTGDIFRIQLDRFNFSYGIITGQLKKIRKWVELPKGHSFNSIMLVPIMVRYYDIITTDSNLKAENLADIPLSRVDICSDSDIIWGTHTIVDHKELDENDIEFNLICTKIQKRVENQTPFLYENLLDAKLIPESETYNLYVEWGTAVTELAFEDISDRFKEYMKNYISIHRGVALEIGGNIPEFLGRTEPTLRYKMNLLNDINKDMRQELLCCLGLNPDADFDDFARKFGGLTKKEILGKPL